MKPCGGNPRPSICVYLPTPRADCRRMAPPLRRAVNPFALGLGGDILIGPLTAFRGDILIGH